MTVYTPPAAGEVAAREARDLLDAYDAAPDGTSVMDGSGVVIRKYRGLWIPLRASRAPMTTAELLRQLCPDLTHHIDQITKDAR